MARSACRRLVVAVAVGEPRLRESLLFDRVELGLRDRAVVEQLLRLLDLFCRPAAGSLPHVFVKLRSLTLRPLERA